MNMAASFAIAKKNKTKLEATQMPINRHQKVMNKHNMYETLHNYTE